MLTFTIRRLIIAVPTLLFISLVIFLLLELAPGDPMAQVPLTVPPEVKEKMRLALGLGVHLALIVATAEGPGLQRQELLSVEMVGFSNSNLQNTLRKAQSTNRNQQRANRANRAP